MKMGLLKSVENVKDVDLYDYRDCLYYNKYEYRLRLNVPGSRYTYWCKRPEDLILKLAHAGKKYANVRLDDVKTVTDNLPALKELILINKERNTLKNYTCRLEGNTYAIFCSDLNILNQLKNRVGNQYALDITQAQTGGFVGVKYFVRTPKRKFRVYLKSKRVPDNLHTDLKEMFRTQKKLYPSEALKLWINKDPKNYGSWVFKYSSSSHFIDYDEESTLSYLALMHGDLLGKRYKLEKRPVNT